jgi:hypothetical protein
VAAVNPAHQAAPRWRLAQQRGWQPTASPINRMGTSVEDGWRESSRTPRRAPAPRRASTRHPGAIALDVDVRPAPCSHPASARAHPPLLEDRRRRTASTPSWSNRPAPLAPRPPPATPVPRSPDLFPRTTRGAHRFSWPPRERPAPRPHLRDSARDEPSTFISGVKYVGATPAKWVGEKRRK